MIIFFSVNLQGRLTATPSEAGRARRGPQEAEKGRPHTERLPQGAQGEGSHHQRHEGLSRLVNSVE